MSSVEAAFAIMASAVIVLGGLAAVARMLFKVAIDIRDNKKATEANTKALGSLSASIDGRFDRLTKEVEDLKIQFAAFNTKTRPLPR